MAVFSGNGSNTAPSFTFSSDTNTGMYRSNADVLNFTVGGNSRLRISDASGVGQVNITARKFGFNSTSTTDVFHVFGNVTGTAIPNPNSTGSAQIAGSVGFGTMSYLGSNCAIQSIRPNGAFADNEYMNFIVTTTLSRAPRATLSSGSFNLFGTLPSAPTISLTSGGNITASGSLSCGSVSSSGSAYFVQTGTTAVTKTLTTAGSTNAKRRSYLIFISNSFGEFGGNGSQRTYSLGIWTPGNTGGVWVEIAGKATDSNTGNLSITASGGNQLTVTKSAGISATNTGLVIQLLDSAEGLITIT